MNLLIVTPLMPPAVGGGGVYTTLLAHELLDRHLFEKVLVVTEKFPNQPGDDYQRHGRLYIKRLFPFRCGVPKKDWTSYIKYAYQNLQFYQITDLIRQHDINSLMVHNYFHNYVSLMGWFVRRFLAKNSLKAICDVRDPRMSRKDFKRIYPYQKIICCSENIFQHFSQDPNLKEKLLLIPIISEISKPTSQEIKRCKVKYQLESVPYIFSSSGVYADKGTDTSLAIVQRLRSLGENYTLVIAGKKRDWTSGYQNAVDVGVLKYLGTIPHPEVLALTAGASINIHIG